MVLGALRRRTPPLGVVSFLRMNADIFPAIDRRDRDPRPVRMYAGRPQTKAPCMRDTHDHGTARMTS